MKITPPTLLVAILSLFTLTCVSIASPAHAQDEGCPVALEQEPTDLARAVRPLFQSEVSACVQAQLEAIKNSSGEWEAPAGSTVEVPPAEMLARADVLIEVLERKGGDATEAKQYLTSVRGGLAPDLSGVNAFVKSVREWAVDDEGGIKWLKRIGAAVGVLIGAFILAMIVGAIVSRAVGRLKKSSELLKEFVVSISRRAVLLIGFFVALGQLGLEIGPFLAAIGAAGFILAFALQGTLSNFAAGVMLLVYRPFDVGDAVTVAGQSGSIKSMNLVSTTLSSWDNQKIIVPNSSIWGDVIVNITGNPTRRVDMKFGISYADDIEKARGILENILQSHELVLDDPAYTVKLHELADSSVNFVVRPWVNTSDYWGVYWDITRAVKQEFDAQGVSIPFPQRDVHLFQEPANA